MGKAEGPQFLQEITETYWADQNNQSPPSSKDDFNPPQSRDSFNYPTSSSGGNKGGQGYQQQHGGKGNDKDNWNYSSHYHGGKSSPSYPSSWKSWDGYSSW